MSYTIQGIYHKNIIKERFFWSDDDDSTTIGPQGPEGPIGQTGPPGPIGAEGPMGIRGERGPIGPAGPIGPEGQEGSSGPTGERGNPGSRGMTGPKGNKGVKGEKGDKGSRGYSGTTGLQGPKGDKGDKGDKGNRGIQGPRGLTGPRGIPGPAGQTNENTNSNESNNLGLDEKSSKREMLIKWLLPDSTYQNNKNPILNNLHVSDKLGIGTTKPKSAFHVSNIAPSGDWSALHGIRIGGEFSNGKAKGRNFLQLGVKNNGHAWIQSFDESKSENSGDYKDVILQPAGGRVGIGINNPTSKLHVNGVITANNFKYSNGSELVGPKGDKGNKGNKGDKGDKGDSASLSSESCVTRYGGCDGAHWGQGTGHGNEYFDRLGGGVNHVANCQSNEYLKGMGIARCNHGRGLRFKMNCCKR